MLEQLENCLVDKAAAVCSGSIRVAPWPDSPQEFNRPQNRASIFIRVGDISLQATQQSHAPFVQPGSLDCEIRIVVQNLRTHTGAYGAIESIHQVLTGYLPESTQGYTFLPPGMQLVRSGLIDRLTETAQWDWGMRFTFPILYETPYLS